MRSGLLYTAAACMALGGAPATRAQGAAPADTGAARYAQSILTLADSAIGVLRAGDADRALLQLESDSAGARAVNADSLATAASVASGSITRIAEDFDMRPPPPWMARVHQQLVDALKVAANAADSVALAAMGCSEAPDNLRRCKIAALGAVTAHLGASVTYKAARKRAALLLTEHGIALPRAVWDDDSTAAP